MDTKLGRMVTYLDGFLPVKSHDALVTWSYRIMWQTKIRSHGLARSCENKKYIFTTTIFMATKLGRMVTYLDYLLPTKSNDHIITCFCEITWQTNTILSPLPQCLWPYNLGRMMTYLVWLLPIKSHDNIITWSCKIT